MQGRGNKVIYTLSNDETRYDGLSLNHPEIKRVLLFVSEYEMYT